MRKDAVFMDTGTNEILNDRLIIDFEEIKGDILSISEDLLQFRIDKNIRNAVGEEFIEKLHKWDSNIKKRLQDDFSIVVIGDFKRGKSTFINALLGEYVAVTNVTPETVTINCISYGEEAKAEAVLKNGRRAQIDLKELEKDELEKLMQKLPSPVDYIDIKLPCETLKGIKIVDTPGVGDILSKFDNQVKEYLVFADAVIYIVSALAPFSLTEQTFLCASILPQNFSKLFVLLNMADCLESKEEVEKIKGLIDSKLSNIFTNSKVYPISGLDEYCRKKGKERPNPELSEMLEKSFNEMYEALMNDIIMKKDIIQSDRCLNIVKLMINDIDKQITLINNMADLNQNKLNAMVEQYENENSELMQNIKKHKQSLILEIENMKNEAVNWMEEFLTSLKAEIKGAENVPIETLEKYFHFYMIDMIRNAVMECTNTHFKRISELLKDSLIKFESEFASFSASDNKISSSIADVSWTNMDLASAALNYIPGIGELAMLGQAIIGFEKQKKSSDQQKKYIENILVNYNQIKVSVISDVSDVYEKMISFALEQLDKTYEEQITSSIAAINHARDISNKEMTEKQEIMKGLSEAKKIIDMEKEKLSKYN